MEKRKSRNIEGFNSKKLKVANGVDLRESTGHRTVIPSRSLLEGM